MKSDYNTYYQSTKDLGVAVKHITEKLTTLQDSANHALQKPMAFNVFNADDFHSFFLKDSYTPFTSYAWKMYISFIGGGSDPWIAVEADTHSEERPASNAAGQELAVAAAIEVFVIMVTTTIHAYVNGGYFLANDGAGPIIENLLLYETVVRALQLMLDYANTLGATAASGTTLDDTDKVMDALKQLASGSLSRLSHSPPTKWVTESGYFDQMHSPGRCPAPAIAPPR